MKIRFSNLKQLNLVSSENRPIGKLRDLLIEEDSWAVQYLVVVVNETSSSFNLLVEPTAIDSFDLRQKSARTLLSSKKLLEGPRLDRNKWLEAPWLHDLQGATDVCRYQIRSRNGWAGTMKDLVIDARDWRIAHAVAEPRSWLPNESSMFSTRHINSINELNREVSVDLSKERLIPSLLVV